MCAGVCVVSVRAGGRCMRVRERRREGGEGKAGSEKRGEEGKRLGGG